MPISPGNSGCCCGGIREAAQVGEEIQNKTFPSTEIKIIFPLDQLRDWDLASDMPLAFF